MSYFQEQYDKLSPEQKRYIYDRDRASQMARCMFRKEPVPEPVAPPVDNARVDRKLQEQDAVINNLENKVNGTMKMAHTHSKGSKKYNTYSV